MTYATPTGAARDITRLLSHSKRLLAVTHSNPDGDAIGSLTAFGHIAKALGIDVRLYCDSVVPDYLDWVEYPSRPVTSLAELGGWQPDTVVFLDCADAQRAGDEMAAFLAARPSGVTFGCIDHHRGNPLFADVNWVDPSIAATGVMVALIARELGIPLSGGLGEAVYLAIVSDTGSFSFSNTSALALELAAEIVRNGLSLADFTDKYENVWTLQRLQLWGTLMRGVKILCNGKIVLSIVTDEVLREYDALPADIEGYASRLRQLKGSRIVIVVRSKGSGCKVSMRSSGEVDVQKIAAQFGGGGHKSAAGVDMPQQPFEAAEIILKAACDFLGEEYTPLERP